MKRSRTSQSYPKGYNPQKRRFAVSSESINPLNSSTFPPRNGPKSEEERARIRGRVGSMVLFKHMDEEQLHDLVEVMHLVHYREGEVILKEGVQLDQDTMFLIDEGSAEVVKGNSSYVLGTGECFGETALVHGFSHDTAVVKAITPCKLWSLNRNTFRHFLMDESIRKRLRHESFLTKVPLFGNMVPQEITRIADALETQYFADGDVIIWQGSTETDKFYIVEKGNVVCKKSDDEGEGDAVECLQLGPGDYFGELALLSNQPRQATVIALGKAKCLTIGRGHFNSLMGPCSDILKRNMTLYKSYSELVATSKQSDNYPARTREELIDLFVKEQEAHLNTLSIAEWFQLKLSTLPQTPSDKETLNNIFSNTKDLLNSHKKHYQILLKAQEDNDALGNLLLTLPLNLYEAFVTDFPKSIIGRKIIKENQILSKFVQNCEEEVERNLDQVMLAILLHVPKLLKSLKQILDITESDHHDKCNLTNIKKKLKNINEEITELFSK